MEEDSVRAVAQSLAPGEFQTLLAFVITGRSSLSGPCLLLPFPQECPQSFSVRSLQVHPLPRFQHSFVGAFITALYHIVLKLLVYPTLLVDVGFPGGASCLRDEGLIPGLGRSPGGGQSVPLQ